MNPGLDTDSPKGESTRYRLLVSVLVGVACFFLAVDQAGKGWAFSPWRQPPGLREILPGIYAGAQGRNDGGMLSLEGTGSAVMVWTLSAIVFILLGMMLRWAIVLDRDRWRTVHALAAGLLLGGILGNQMDRLFLGYVRDYLIWARFPCQIFNTADLFMVLGAFLLLASLVISRDVRAIPEAYLEPRKGVGQ